MKFETNVEAQTITMRGGIGDFDDHISADDFLSALGEHDGGDVTIHLDSPGGSVTEGLSIYNSLVQYEGRVVIHVDTIAASIASVIACAADALVVNSNAKIMIHRCFTAAMGNCTEFRQMATIMEMMDADIAAVYAEKSGVDDVAQWLALMDTETWFTAEEAVNIGLADRIHKVERKTKPKAEAMAKVESLGPVYAAIADMNARRIKLRTK